MMLLPRGAGEAGPVGDGAEADTGQSGGGDIEQEALAGEGMAVLTAHPYDLARANSQQNPSNLDHHRSQIVQPVAASYDRNNCDA